MTETKHTPGPWVIYTGRKLEYWRGDGTEIIGPDGRIADAGCDGLRFPAECRANARLIAAAPGLLEALEAILGECILPPQVQDLADAAIAKASGPPASSREP